MKRVFKALFMGLGMFTALPCPYRPWDEDARGLMLVCLPVVGAVIGLLWSVLAVLAHRLLPACAAALTVALPWLLTGFMHLDGYMDTCDALLSWRPLEHRLRILKDAHTGAFAVVGMAMLALFSYDAVRSIPAERLAALIFVPVVSRCGSAFCVLSLKPISHSEYAATSGNAAQRMAVAAMWGLALIACGLWLNGSAVVALLLETLAYLLAMLWAVRVLKGVSGDLAGFALSIAECAALVALANIPL